MIEEFIAVIGANYGDEGKGRLTNYLANDKSMVVRYSGSAQAGHTVVEEQRRHVFKHHGSATLRGVPTYLSESFLSHPIMFTRERELLADVEPEVFVDGRSQVVLPTDMIINQAAERCRGDDKHGSCGMGVRQAQERGMFPLLRVEVSDLEEELLRKRLSIVCQRHLETWATMNGVTGSEVLEIAGVKNFSGVLQKFEHEAESFLRKVVVADDESEVDDAFALLQRVVFEGSQGLALDPSNHGRLPYLTPSHVGLGGITSFFDHNKEMYADELELVYVTRPYLTRHGAGPLPAEGAWMLSPEDVTNVPNDWQDALRFAPLNFMDLALRVLRDLEWLSLWPGEKPKLKISLAVSCLDQVENTDFPFADLNGNLSVGLSNFLNECGFLLDYLSHEHGRGRLITCYGESRDDTHDSGADSGISQAA